MILRLTQLNIRTDICISCLVCVIGRIVSHDRQCDEESFMDFFSTWAIIGII